MEQKSTNLYNALMHQAEFNIERFDRRREHSWRVALSLWAAILGTFAVGSSIIETKGVPLIIVAGVSLSIIGLHWFWLSKVSAANRKDKTLAFRARDRAIELLDKELDQPKR